MKIKFVLAETLKLLDVTPDKLAQESKIRSATIYEMVEGKALSIKLDTLTRILDTLNLIAAEAGIDKQFKVSDVFKSETD